VFGKGGLQTVQSATSARWASSNVCNSVRSLSGSRNFRVCVDVWDQLQPSAVMARYSMPIVMLFTKRKCVGCDYAIAAGPFRFIQCHVGPSEQ
jgi:hypothetical protein